MTESLTDTDNPEVIEEPDTQDLVIQTLVDIMNDDAMSDIAEEDTSSNNINNNHESMEH